MLVKYDSFINEGVVEEMPKSDLYKIIDDTYKHFKKLRIKVNTKDIIDYIEENIGKELDDDDYELLYYKITGVYPDSNVIDDLDDEEKYFIE